MTFELNPLVIAYLVGSMILIDAAVAYDLRRRRLPWIWLLLPVLFGPPGGMAYFIARPPAAND